ncbi:LacI family DNA-binding transcriptional regulator [Streptomyces sp. NPDC059627]
MTPPRRSTSADVAREAGVSRATVSYVLNDRPGQVIPEATRRRVLEAAERLEYRPHASAKALAAGHSDVVLLSIPDLPIGPSISRFVEELAGALAGQGLTLVTHLMGAHGRPLPDVCAAVAASAVIGFDSFDESTLQALRRMGVRVVLPDEADHFPAMPPLGRMQAEHLLARGHRSIGYLMPAQPGFRSMAEERLRGVREKCHEAGIEPPLVLVGELDISALTPLLSQWRERGVTGVCAFNDEHAIALLATVREAGLSVPKDLAVVGADDIPMARFAAPALSTVYFDLQEAGRHRAEAVVASLSGTPVSSTVPSTSLRLRQRSST